MNKTICCWQTEKIYSFLSVNFTKRKNNRKHYKCVCDVINVCQLPSVDPFRLSFQVCSSFKRPKKSKLFVTTLKNTFLPNSFFQWQFCCPNTFRFLFRIARSRRLNESYQRFFFCYGSEVFPHLGLSPDGLLSLPSAGFRH